MGKETPKYSIINSPNGFLQGKSDYRALEARAS
jgi:hypothetical protein